MLNLAVANTWLQLLARHVTLDVMLNAFLCENWVRFAGDEIETLNVSTTNTDWDIETAIPAIIRIDWDIETAIPTIITIRRIASIKIPLFIDIKLNKQGFLCLNFYWNRKLFIIVKPI